MSLAANFAITLVDIFCSQPAVPEVQVSIPEDPSDCGSKDQILDEMHTLLMKLRIFGFYDY